MFHDDVTAPDLDALISNFGRLSEFHRTQDLTRCDLVDSPFLNDLRKPPTSVKPYCDFEGHGASFGSMFQRIKFPHIMSKWAAIRSSQRRSWPQYGGLYTHNVVVGRDLRPDELLISTVVVCVCCWHWVIHFIELSPFFLCLLLFIHFELFRSRTTSPPPHTSPFTLPEPLPLTLSPVSATLSYCLSQFPTLNMSPHGLYLPSLPLRITLFTLHTICNAACTASSDCRMGACLAEGGTSLAFCSPLTD